MDFRGHLRLPDDAGTGIPVVLRLDDIFVIITSGGEELGAWRADDVLVERIFSNQFAIDLDGEPMVFVAQDALGFAYEGITAIEDLQARLTKRSLFRRSKKKDRKEVATETESPPAPVKQDPTRRPAAELVSHLDDEPEAVQQPGGGYDEAYEETFEEAGSIEPTPLWTPPAASSTAPQQSSDAVRPQTRRGESETEDVRVSYPQVESPTPPSVDSFVPPEEEAERSASTQPDTDRVAPQPEQAAEPQAARPEPEPLVEPEPEPVVEPEPEPAMEAEPQPEPVEVELEIEEVGFAASGTAWDDEVAVSQPEREVEIEIEDYVPPTASAVDTFRPPSEATTSDEEAVADLPAAIQPESEPEPEPEPEPESEPVADVEPLPEPVADVEPVAEVEPEPDAEETAADTARPAAAERNGHLRKPEKKRSFLFGRGRDKSVPEHDHEYGEPKTIGGLTRQVCEICGHVTFSGQDVYQDW